MRKASGFKSFVTEITTRPRESPPAARRIAAAPNSLTGPGTRLVTSVAAAAANASSEHILPATANQRLIPYLRAGKLPIAMIHGCSAERIPAGGGTSVTLGARLMGFDAKKIL